MSVRLTPAAHRLLAQSRDHVVANLQLHGMRPPPSLAPSFVVPHLNASSSSSQVSDAGPAARSAILPWNDPRLRDDVLRLIDQFLAEEGLGATRQMLSEEWSGKVKEREEKSGDARTIRKGILGALSNPISSDREPYKSREKD